MNANARVPWTLSTEDPLAVRAVAAIHAGDGAALRQLLDDHPRLAFVRLRSDPDADGPGPARSLLHVATDWPGHFPDVGATIRILVAAGADPDARFTGPHTETPLHWAASSDDVEALDALLDLGADIDADGAVIGGGTALSDAAAFANWKSARRLVERGATATLWEAAALGLLDRLRDQVAASSPSSEDITHMFWCACHGGQRITAEYAHGLGADLNWVGYDHLTPLEAAERSGADELVVWLLGLGALRAGDLAD